MSDHCVRHLLQEHRELEVLDGLESVLQQLAKEPPGKAACESSVGITQVLRRHLERLLRKKDGVFFPALGAFLPLDQGPLEVAGAVLENTAARSGAYSAPRAAKLLLSWLAGLAKRDCAPSLSLAAYNPPNPALPDHKTMAFARRMCLGAVLHGSC